ncbi:MAG: hypothetical protein KDD60_08360, partial [Bdellovibrionales bacterium]|nr:hypothetical protein [Bdellovibrionales bacterium]
MHSQTNFERKALERELIHHCEGSELAFGKALYYWERGDRSLANQALKDGAAALDALDSKIQESLQKTGWFGRGPTRAQSLGVDLESSQQYLRAAREVTPLYEKIVSGQGVEVSQILESWQQSPMAKQHHTAQGHVNGVRSLPQNVLILSPSSTPFESNAFSVGVAEKVITAHGQALLGCLALERNDDDAMRFHSDVLQAIIERGTIGPLSTDSTRRAFAPALNTVTAHIPRPPRETISLRGHFLEHPEQTLSLIERALLKEDQIVVIEEKLFELGRTLANHSSQTLIEDYVRVATLYGLYHSTSDRTVQTHNDNTLKFITYVENRFPNSEIIPLAKCALLYRQNPEAENSGPILLALRQGINRQTGAVAILSAMQVLQHAQGLKEVAPTARADLAVNILNRTKECPDSRGAHATRAAQSEAKEILISNATTEEQLRVAIGVLDDRLIQGKLFFDGIGNKPSQAREHRLREQVFYDSDRLLILA